MLLSRKEWLSDCELDYSKKWCMGFSYGFHIFMFNIDKKPFNLSIVSCVLMLTYTKVTRSSWELIHFHVHEWGIFVNRVLAIKVKL